jgi:hypothetical protein
MLFFWLSGGWVLCLSLDFGDYLLILVGGGAGGKSMFLPTAGGQSLAVSKPIDIRAQR